MIVKNFLRILVLGVTVFFMASCGYIPHDVTINPNLTIEKQNIGKNKTMVVSVSDDRNKSIVGHRTYMKTGPISLSREEELAHDIKLVIEDGFKTLGFSIIQKGNPDRAVDVDIRLIEYEAVWGFFTMGAFARGSFQVTCVLPSGKKFENIYRVEHEHRAFLVPFASTNTSWINKAVSEALMRMFRDGDFMDFLRSEN